MPFTTQQIQAARSFAIRSGLPALTGTPSQIEWAEQIRMRVIKNIERQIRSGQGYQRTAVFQGNRERLLQHTSASWWIENRNRAGVAAVRRQNSEFMAAYASLLRPASRAS